MMFESGYPLLYHLFQQNRKKLPLPYTAMLYVSLLIYSVDCNSIKACGDLRPENHLPQFF